MVSIFFYLTDPEVAMLNSQEHAPDKFGVVLNDSAFFMFYDMVK